MLERLLTHRGTELAQLAAASGVAEPELRALIAGAAPGESQLRALAPALGFHAADLFVIADTPVPEDLTPLDPNAGGAVASLLEIMMSLPPERRRRVHRLMAEMPREPRPQDVPETPQRLFGLTRRSVGAPLVTMLVVNRNLRSHTAYVAAFLTRERMYLSRVTYPMIASGVSPLRPELIMGFATVLGIPAGDLAALTGIALPDEPVRDDPLAAELARLLWDLRRLSSTQTRQLVEEAKSMLVRVPDGASMKEWIRIIHVPGQGWLGGRRAPGE